MRACLGSRHAAGARPGDGALLAVHLPGVLLVVEYLLVSSTRSVLHVGQGADPARHFKLQLLVVNLNSGIVTLSFLVRFLIFTTWTFPPPALCLRFLVDPILDSTLQSSFLFSIFLSPPPGLWLWLSRDLIRDSVVQFSFRFSI